MHPQVASQSCAGVPAAAPQVHHHSRACDAWNSHCLAWPTTATIILTVFVWGPPPTMLRNYSWPMLKDSCGSYSVRDQTQDSHMQSKGPDPFKLSPWSPTAALVMVPCFLPHLPATQFPLSSGTIFPKSHSGYGTPFRRTLLYLPAL